MSVEVPRPLAYPPPPKPSLQPSPWMWARKRCYPKGKSLKWCRRHHSLTEKQHREIANLVGGTYSHGDVFELQLYWFELCYILTIRNWEWGLGPEGPATGRGRGAVASSSLQALKIGPGLSKALWGRRDTHRSIPLTLPSEEARAWSILGSIIGTRFGPTPSHPHRVRVPKRGTFSRIFYNLHHRTQKQT